MITVSIDKKEVKEMTAEEIKRVIKEMDTDFVYWDAKELMRRTCMSWNFIQEQFFFDPAFPKFKVGSKWYFPARDTRSFLESWLRSRTS